MNQVNFALILHCDNRFHTLVSLLYPLKMSRSLWFFNVFRAFKNEILARNGLAMILHKSLLKKCPYSEFSWSKCGKIRTRKTPDTDTFDAVNG